MARAKSKYSPSYIKSLLELFATYTHDPVKFVKAAFKWGEGDLVGQYPQDWQLNLLEDIKDGLKTVDEVIRIAIASGHGIGKSALVAWLILWAISTREDTKGIVTANTDSQLKTKTWAELAKWYHLFIGKPLFTLTATAIFSSDPKYEKTWRIDALPWNKDKSEGFAGLHNNGKRILCIFDEASNIPIEIWEVVEGATSDKDTEIIWCCFGNPTRNSGPFYNCFNSLRDVWHTKQIDSRSVSISNKTQLEQWIKQYGADSDFARVRIYGQFPKAADGQLISVELVEAAFKAYETLHIRNYVNEPIVFGVDPAWTGKDSLVAYMRQGIFTKKILEIAKNDNDMVVAGKLAALQDKYGMDKGFIDMGFGTGIYSALKSMGRGENWSLISFASTPNDEYYYNKRAEMWDLMRKWLEDGGALKRDQTMYNDLISPESEINGKSKLQLESKKHMKERGLPSPNNADALALTFAQPVRKSRGTKYRIAKAKGKIRKYGKM